MKHSLKITALLLGMFFLAQIIGIGVTWSYNSYQKQNNQQGIPDFIAPPEGTNPWSMLISIGLAIFLGVIIMFTLMKFGAETFLRIWFFLVIIIAISLTLNALLIHLNLGNLSVNYKFLIAILIALPLAIIKIFVRNIKVHNFTELLVYPGVSALFVPLLNIWSVVVLLILISLYDMYAVWHSGIMQKMAKYQINQVKIFAGFFVPYMRKKDRELIRNSKSKSALKDKKIKVNLAILGGGDIVFPIILAGVVFIQFGFLSALIISVGALLGLTGLFYISQKGKFYPAMPFISLGCFIALGLVYLISLI